MNRQPVKQHNLGLSWCIVPHTDKQGNPVPKCRWCIECKEWINYWNENVDCDEAKRQQIERRRKGALV
jgi:hypothetical protein